MLLTVAIVVVTHNLAIGVLVGVIVSALLYAYRSATQLHVQKELYKDELIYRVHGQLFFVSSDTLLERIDFADETGKVCLDFQKAHIWDQTARQTIDKIVQRLEEKGKRVRLSGQSFH